MRIHFKTHLWKFLIRLYDVIKWFMDTMYDIQFSLLEKTLGNWTDKLDKNGQFSEKYFFDKNFYSRKGF